MRRLLGPDYLSESARTPVATKLGVLALRGGLTPWPRTTRETVELFLPLRLLRWVRFEAISCLVALAKTKIVMLVDECFDGA